LLKVSHRETFFFDLNFTHLTAQADTYLTISASSSGIFKDKGSKFLSFAYQVKNTTEIKEIIDKLKKEYFDARHHCYAYRLGADKLVFRANDDGEPSGTGGKPILGQILSHDLTNIVIVVVRYFGGTLLGTSGLINAYKAATANAIANASIVQKHVHAIYQLTFGYPQMNHVMKIIKDFELEAFDQSFELTCTMRLKIQLGHVDIMLEKLSGSGVEAVFVEIE
jgi:uncharacterized YigZ family protein